MELDAPDHVQPLRRQLLDFMEEYVYPAEPILDRGWRDPEAWATMDGLRKEAKTRGLWAMGHPKDIGGGGLSFLDYVYVNEVVGRSRHGLFATGTETFQDSLMLQRFAAPVVRDRFLRPLVDGDVSCSFSMTEPNVGSSDPTQLRATAVLENGYWRVNGRKWFTGRVGRAAFITVVVKTDPEQPGRRGFSLIVVPTDVEGIEIIRSVPAMGFVDGDHCEVEYHDVRVPQDHLLGDRGRGFVIAQQRLGPGRIAHCMRWLGQAQRAFELMCDRAVRRQAFGSALADKELVQQMVFQTAAEIHAHRLMTLDAARRLDAGEQARVEISLIKVMGAAMVHNAIDRAIQVFGGAGVTADTPLESMYRYARYARIYDGPDEVHEVNVAKLLLEPFRRDVAEAP
jgi:alkylation response protein AidB-like acyl-CoA dehydrogenase